MKETLINVVKELQGYGLDDGKIFALYQLAMDDFLEEMENDFVDASIDDLEILKKEIADFKFEDMVNNKKDAFSIALKKIYGVQGESKLTKFLVEYFTDALNQAKAAKVLLEKAQKGDPETLKALNEAKKSEDYESVKALMDEMAKEDK